MPGKTPYLLLIFPTHEWLSCLRPTQLHPLRPHTNRPHASYLPRFFAAAGRKLVRDAYRMLHDLTAVGLHTVRTKAKLTSLLRGHMVNQHRLEKDDSSHECYCAPTHALFKILHV
jgi:hypothetical protein